MELRLPHMLHLFNVFRENDGNENCAQVLKEELHRMLGIKYVNDEHDCNVVSMNSLNTHDANDMQSHKLGDAMFDEDDLFSSPTLNAQNYYDESMPPIYDDYCDDTYAIRRGMIKVVILLCILSLNITLLMWKQFVVFKSFTILPLILMRINFLMWRVENFLCL